MPEQLKYYLLFIIAFSLVIYLRNRQKLETGNTKRIDFKIGFLVLLFISTQVFIFF